MGQNTSCTVTMGNYLKENSLFYKFRNIIMIGIILITLFYYGQEFENMKTISEAWKIILILGVLLFINNFIDQIAGKITTLFFIDKSLLEEYINNCKIWQDKNKDLCKDEIQGECIIDPYLIVDYRTE